MKIQRFGGAKPPSSVPRVTLELVRQGPAHNQLLSPLTPYFAICGNHEPEVVHVPFEHATLLRKLRNLRYVGPGGVSEGSEISADAEDIRRGLMEMFSSIRSLGRDLSATSKRGIKLIALELVVSAAELSLLPFELVFRPGMPTLELSSAEVVIVRRTKRVPAAAATWPPRPRVLFAYADVAGPVPFARHLLALRQCHAPWLAHVENESVAIAADEVKKYVTVIERATLPAIRDACERMARRQQEITHVHILGHGTSKNGKFGLMLHHPADSLASDFVTGERLAGALNATNANGDNRRPACVTIAACDGGNTGDVVYVGSSVAHELHEGGIPFVVASQFPLSFRGSVAMVQELYEHLLQVMDPQVALAKTRHALQGWSTSGPGQMDWASVVAYGALPKRLDYDVTRGRIEQAKRAIESAVAIADPFVNATGRPEVSDKKATAEDVLRAWKELGPALSRLLENSSSLECSYYLGAFYKRWGDIVGRLSPNERSRLNVTTSYVHEPAEVYRQASEHYKNVFVLHGQPGALVQSLACRCFCGAAYWPVDVAEAMRREWHTALNLIQIREGRKEVQAYAMEDERALLELSLMIPFVFNEPDAREVARKALRDTLGRSPSALIEKLQMNGKNNEFELYSLMRQVERFESLSPMPVDAVQNRADLVQYSENDGHAHEQYHPQYSAPADSVQYSEDVGNSALAQIKAKLKTSGVRRTWTATTDYQSFGGKLIPVVSSKPDV